MTTASSYHAPQVKSSLSATAPAYQPQADWNRNMAASVLDSVFSMETQSTFETTSEYADEDVGCMLHELGVGCLVCGDAPEAYDGTTHILQPTPIRINPISFLTQPDYAFSERLDLGAATGPGYGCFGTFEYSKPVFENWMSGLGVPSERLDLGSATDPGYGDFGTFEYSEPIFENCMSGLGMPLEPLDLGAAFGLGYGGFGAFEYSKPVFENWLPGLGMPLKLSNFAMHKKEEVEFCDCGANVALLFAASYGPGYCTECRYRWLEQYREKERAQAAKERAQPKKMRHRRWRLFGL